MPAPDASFILDRFLQERVRQSVVRLSDPSLDTPSSSGGYFTGCFLSQSGHLLTAFHPLKHQLFEPDRPVQFELRLEFDSTLNRFAPDATCFYVLANYEPGWSNFRADWAFLKIDFQAPSYLSVVYGGYMQSNPGDCLELRAYGFSEDQPESPCLGAYEGQLARLFPERSQFRASFIDRG